MVLHNPNNWHWVSRETLPWAKDYLSQKLIGIKADDKAVSATITKLISLDGDAEVSQRKGKVITIFDVKAQLEYSGNTAEGESVSGTITIPEIAHDTEEVEYVFDIDMYSEISSKQPVKDLVRRAIVPQLRTALGKLGPAMIDEHGKDIQHAPGSNPSGGFTAVPTYASTNKPSSSSTGGTCAPASSKTALNTTTVNATDEFRTTADELYTTFTDPQRLAAFTRAAPRVFEGAHSGAAFSLFDGNVTGSYVTLQPGKRIVQKWRLGQWAEGHHSTLEIGFDQNDVDRVTVMRVKWDGVPVGQEDVVKANWDGYYVRSIKQTFGFGTIL